MALPERFLKIADVRGDAVALQLHRMANNVVGMLPILMLMFMTPWPSSFLIRAVFAKPQPPYTPELIDAIPLLDTNRVWWSAA